MDSKITHIYDFSNYYQTVLQKNCTNLYDSVALNAHISSQNFFFFKV